jgi:hypothetical protein
MDLIRAALLEAGSRIAPLTSLDQIASFFFAAATIGSAAPARATDVALRLGGSQSLVNAASMLASILASLPSMPNVERLLKLLPPCEDMSIGPTCDMCAVCEHGMIMRPAGFATATAIDVTGMPLLQRAELSVLQGLGDGLQNWTKSVSNAEYTALSGA